MRIHKMTATFAGLSEATLVLAPGLNVIQGPNEGGKSSWCAFLRAMLFGIPTRERDRQDYVAEKNRYQPWSGRAMEGTVELTWKGEEITLRRFPRGNVPFGGFSAVYSATGEKVPGMTGENCAQLLLGVSREIYERTAFVGQGGMTVGESAELEGRIAALLASGEEEVSYSATDALLRTWLNRRKFNKSGLIPKTETELAVLEDTLTRQAGAREAARQARQELEELLPRQRALSQAVEAWQGREHLEQRRNYEAAQKELEEARERVEGIKASLNRHGAPPDRETLQGAQEQFLQLRGIQTDVKVTESQVQKARQEAEELQEGLPDPLFPDLTPQEAMDKAHADAKNARARPKSPAVLLGAGILSLLGAGACLILSRGEGAGGYLGGATILLLLLGLALPAAALVLRRRTARIKGELLAYYGAISPQDMMDRASDYARRSIQAEEARRRAREAEESLAALVRRREELSQALFALIHTFEPEVTDFYGVSAALSRTATLQEKLAEAQARLEMTEKLVQRLPKPEGKPCPEEGEEAAEEDFDPDLAREELETLERTIARLRTDLATATGEMKSLGDPLLFETQRQERQEELSRRQEEYAALTLARECLAQADREMRKRFSPALNAKAGEILAVLTGGKYDKLTLTRAFEAQVGDPPHRSLLLSQGTEEQVYLAVRLAVCALALPREERVPIVLDEALANFDDGRMAFALEYLLSLGREQQILLFTCHTRESRAMEGREGAKLLSLQS